MTEKETGTGNVIEIGTGTGGTETAETEIGTGADVVEAGPGNVDQVTSTNMTTTGLYLCYT